MLIRAAAISDRGTAREKNDDHYCLGSFVEQETLTTLTVERDSAFFRDYGLLAAVADGMGGYAGGDVASRVVLETLSALYYGESRRGCDIRELAASLERYLQQTQKVLTKTLERSREYADAGTTLAGVALMAPDYLVIFHAGDSRVLRGSAGYVRALTVDHTLLGPDVDSGLISEEDAIARPEATQLTCSLGQKGDHRVAVNIDLAWAPGEFFLIGTDGWHGLGRGLPRATIRTLSRKEQDVEKLATALIRGAVAMDGQDNATVVVVQLGERPYP